MKKMLIFIIYIIFTFFILPFLITFLYRERDFRENPKTHVVGRNNNLDSNHIYYIENAYDEDFVNYLIGVVAAEMPANFEIEALKAQAVAARTYAVWHIINEENVDLKQIGQVHMSIEEMGNRWGDSFDYYYNKIRYAVESTRGEIIKYNNEPILAVFHATSTGLTEYSQNVWQTQKPYLVSVDSSFDEDALNFTFEQVFTREEFIELFSRNFHGIEFSSESLLNQIRINEYTEAFHIRSITVANVTMEGTEFRRVLGLRSSNFTMREDGNIIIFTTKGHGHGVGMSQTGANFLAKEGYNYIEILKHYYTGVEIQKLDFEI